MLIILLHVLVTRSSFEFVVVFSFIAFSFLFCVHFVTFFIAFAARRNRSASNS